MNDLENYFNENKKRVIDKWSHYFEVYDRHFSKYRGKEIVLLEIGTFQGGSLQMWKQYFGDKAKIYGIDINPNCKQVEEENIKIMIGSQSDREFLKKVVQEVPPFDILIDDGGHTMLQQIGVESYNVMISPRRCLVRPGFPMLLFGHSIVAIRLPDTINAQSLYAVVNDPKLGRLLFFDPTSEYTPLGYLPPSEQANLALVVTPQGGELIEVPLLAAATNRLLRTGTLSLSSGGDLVGEVNEVRWGGPAVTSREQYLTASPADRQKVLEGFLGTSLTNFSLTSASLGNLEKYDENLMVHYKFAVDAYAKTAGNLLIIRPRVIGEKGSSILSGKPRKYPIEFSEATLQSDMFDITLPAGYVVDELPEPVDAKCDYATYQSNIEVKDNVLHYKRVYEVKGVVVPTEKLPEVRDFFHQVAAAEKSSAVLRRANP